MLVTEQMQYQAPAELLTKVGEWLEGAGHLEMARMYYESALKVDTTFALALFRLGKLAYRTGNYVEATKVLRRAIKFTPDHAPTYYQLALSYEKSGRLRSAVHWARRTLHYNPEHDGAFLVLLRCYAGLRWWRSVLRICIALPQRMHQAGEVKLWQALAYTGLGQFSRASEIFEQVPDRIRKRYEKESRQIDQQLSSVEDI